MKEVYPVALPNAVVACSCCHKVLRLPKLKGHQKALCPRCRTPLHSRYPGAINKTWAWLITGFVLLIPANVLPVMTVTYLGDGQPDTILSGIIHLAEDGQIPIAILVFVASIFVPLLKLIGMSALLVLVQLEIPISLKQCTWLYRAIEFVGRWSMLDLFMISILVTLVDMGSIASVHAGAGATAFATVVVVTMFAAHTFDPRLLWDLTLTEDGSAMRHKKEPEHRWEDSSHSQGST